MEQLSQESPETSQPLGKRARPNRVAIKFGLADLLTPRQAVTISVCGVVGSILIWWIITRSGSVSEVLIPGPVAVIKALIHMQEEGYRGISLAGHVLWSLWRVGAGIFLAVLVGTVLGLLAGRSAVLMAFLDPFVQFLRPLPPLGYYTLLVLWLGIGDSSKIALLFLTGAPVMIVSMAAAVRNIKREYLMIAGALGLSSSSLFWKVVVPASRPAFFTALRLTVGVAFGSLVAAEIVAADRGIGFLIIDSSKYLQTSNVFVGIILIGIIAVVLDRIFVTLERKFVPWAGKGA